MRHPCFIWVPQAFNKRSEKQFDERDQFLLTVVLKQSSTPLENAAAFESERKKEIINQNLLDIGLVLSSEHEFQTLSKMIITKAKKLLNADRCSIIFRNPNTQHLYSNMTDGSKTEFTVPEDSVAGNVAKSGKGINVVDAYLNERFNPEFDEKSGVVIEQSNKENILLSDHAVSRADIFLQWLHQRHQRHSTRIVDLA